MTTHEDPFHTLSRSFEAISRTSAGSATLAELKRREPDLVGFSSVAEVVVACWSPGDPGRARRLVSALFRLAGDELAMTALLVSLRPGLRRVASRYSVATGDDWEDAASEVIATALAVVRDLAAQDDCNEAATIVSRTWGRVRRAAAKRVAPDHISMEELESEDDFAAPGDLADQVAARIDLRELVAGAVLAGALRADEVELVLLRGASSDELVMAVEGTEERTVLLKRRRRAEMRLARYAAESVCGDFEGIGG